jgi:hypothetical protein
VASSHVISPNCKEQAYDTEGKSYLDACAGVHVVSIGHAVPEIVETIADQASKVSFTYGRFLTQPQIDLADNIASRTPEGLTRVFFISGGSEATRAGKAGTATRLALCPCLDAPPGGKITGHTSRIFLTSRRRSLIIAPIARSKAPARYNAPMNWSA